MKRFSRIAVVLLALTVAFALAGCGEEAPATVGIGEYEGEMTLGLFVTGRTADWHALDFPISQLGDKYKITIKGKVYGTGVTFKAGGDAPSYPEFGRKTGQAGEFTFEIAALDGSKLTGQNSFRIQTTDTCDFFIYYIEIEDADGEKVFSLEEWLEENDTFPGTPLAGAGPAQISITYKGIK